MKKIIIPLVIMVAIILSGCNISKETWLVKPAFTYDNIRPLFDYDTKAKIINFTPGSIPEDYGDFKYNDFFYYTLAEKNGLINNKGEIVIDAEAEVYWCFEGLVDKEHNVYNSEFEIVGPSGHGYETQYYDIVTGKICSNQAGPMVYRDEFPEGSGMILPVIKVSKVDEEYGDIQEFYEMDSYVVIYGGKTLTETDIEDGTSFNSDGIAAIKKDDKWGFIDKTGKMIIDFKYDDAFNFNEGVAAVSLDGKWGYINADGSTLIEHKYNKTTSVAAGKAWVRKGIKWGYLQVIA